jgi:hypothetical protein
VFDKLLPSAQPESFMEWTHTSTEQSLAEFYTILFEKRIQVVLEILEMAICSPLYSSKLTRVVQLC